MRRKNSTKMMFTYAECFFSCFLQKFVNFFRNNDCIAGIKHRENLGFRWRSGRITEVGKDYLSTKG